MSTPEQRRAEYQKQIDNAPKCTKCKEPLSGMSFEFEGREFCKNCFKCQGCGATFSGGEAVSVDDLPYCDGCGRNAFVQSTKNKRASVQPESTVTEAREKLTFTELQKKQREEQRKAELEREEKQIIREEKQRIEMEKAEKEREKYEQEKARIAAMRESSTKDESSNGSGVVNFRELERRKREEREQMLKKLADKHGTTSPSSTSTSTTAPLSSTSPTKPSAASGPSKNGADFGYSVTLKGDGSKTAKVNDLAVFTVHVLEKGRAAKVTKDESLQITFDGPDIKIKPKIKYAEKLVAFTVGYKATLPGHYEMHIKFDDMSLGTFPLTVANESGTVPGAAPTQQTTPAPAPAAREPEKQVEKPQPKPEPVAEAKPVHAEVKLDNPVPVAQEHVPVRSESKTDTASPKSEALTPLKLTSPDSPSPSDDLSRGDSMSGLTKEQKLALIRERKSKLLSPRKDSEVFVGGTSEHVANTSEINAKTESESSDDIASAVVTEIRVTFKAVNKNGKPKQSGGDAKKFEVTPHNDKELVDNNDGTYTIKLTKPEHFAVKIKNTTVLHAEFV